MRVLVTGAAGYVGSQIVHTIHRTFNQPYVIGVDNLSNGYVNNLPNGVECSFGDVGSRRFMGNLIRHHKIDRIVHCAASVSVPESVKKSLDYYHNNTMATLALVETARDCRVKGFVFSSTAAVYGQPEFARAYREDDPCRPVSPYGWSKLMSEQMLRDSRPMSTVILRYFNVAGADPLGMCGQGPDAPHLITRAVRSALGGPELVIYGDGKDRRDYVHVQDVATAHLAALDWTEMNDDLLTLNVGRGHGYSVWEVMRAVNDVTGRKVKFSTARPRAGDPHVVLADNRVILKVFNWKPKHGLENMVEHVVQWERNRK